MQKTKELLELFRAIGAHDIPRAAAVSRKLAAQRGARGQYRAERELMSALNGALSPTLHHSPQSNLQTTWASTSSLMPLAADKNLSDLELPRTTQAELAGIIQEWRGREKLAKHGIPRRWRLLFHGPSGCGKSASAAALAVATKLPGYLVRFDSLIGAYLGQTALRLRELFRFAEANPCVLLFDEVDALAKRRGSPMDVGELDRIVIAFMQELEHAHGDGLVIATSNVPAALDAALWRRFDLRVKFPKPNGRQLANFVKHRAHQLGVRADQRIISVSRKSASYAEAEQVVIAEARRRLLASS